MTRFCRIVLRTTDVPAARLFYRALLGDDGADVVPLPAEAITRGARPHWLGHLGVADVESVAQAFVAQGATRLGPTRPTAAGGRWPSFAIRAVRWSRWGRRPGTGTPRRRVALLEHGRSGPGDRQLLRAHGVAAHRADSIRPAGAPPPFAWSPGGTSVGAMADIAGRSGVHPHWLFHFRVGALEPAVAAVRAAGGLVLDPLTLPNGARVAVCDDPQGAAFALQEG